jgi:hypothetical protein
VVGLVLAAGFAPPADAQEPTPTTLTMVGEKQYADLDTTLTLTLQQEGGEPVANAQVEVERRVDGTWQPLTLVVTDEAGQAAATATMARDADDNVFRASYAGDEVTLQGSESGPVRVPLLRRATRVTISGPDEVVDERSITLTVRWRTRGGEPVPGRVLLKRRNPGGDWRVARRMRTGADGSASYRVRPRVDTRWRATARRLDWAEGDRSRVHAVDNLPPGVPVRLPAAAPRPRINLPDQPHAAGKGANPSVTRIPNAVWRHMTGRSWHRGCPVGRAGLRLLRINYWDFSGYRHRGELVAHADAVGQMSGALAEMYRRKLPIRAMYRVDRFGWSSRLRGADDYKSMAADNTSAFNCRGVVGNPSVRSPHSYGRSLDLNPWENPYRTRHGWTPNSWWVGRSHPRVAWRSRSHEVVQVMARHGLRWTYGTSDAHHFDASGNSARMMARWSDCGDGVVCK